MIKTIPLCKLVTSPHNVRRIVNARADLELKADLEARGLLQNLVVTAGRPRGSFAVEAGERRRRALQSLADEGKLPSDHGVCCLVIESAAAAKEASLAENFQRLSMNPADECLAFQQLVEQGADTEAIARRFGLTIRFVEGRLRLAGLAPVIFDALGAGAISLEVAKAYAVTPDRERQAFVFEQVGRSYAANHPDSIRRMMTQATVSGSDRRARFVGEEAYVAAGGRIERDLFSEEASARWLDIALLERLACEKMEQAAAAIAAERGLAFVRPTLDSWISHSHVGGLRRLQVETPALTEAETVRVDELEAEMERLAELIEDEETDGSARDESEAQVRALSDELDAIVNKPPVIEEALRGQAGTFLILDDQGRPRLDDVLYVELSADVDDTDDGQDSPEMRRKPQQSTGLSQRLVDELAMQRRDILAVHLAADPSLAFDLAIFLMIDRQAGCSFEKSGSSLAAPSPSDPLFDFKTPGAAATLARAEATAALDRSWMEGKTRAARFDAFRSLADEERAAWLGHAVANTLEASLRLPGERFCAFHDHLGQLCGVKVARWWRPTGANFFDRVPKGVTLAALADVGGPALAERYAKAKKAELAQSCERIFSGDFIAEGEVKEAALAWIPDAMRFAPLAADGPQLPSAEDPAPTDGVLDPKAPAPDAETLEAAA
jgi:ParB family transcriptional regulator, chromosome partitioning protein